MLLPSPVVDGSIASPFLLVHGVGHDERTWTPLFSLCYFHHTKDGDLSRSKHQPHTMDGIIIGPTATALTLIDFQVQFILTLNMTEVSSALSFVTTIPPSRRSTLLVLGSSVLIPHLTCFSWGL
jgi:hypothetical protein